MTALSPSGIIALPLTRVAETMKVYPRLSEMGVANPQQIAKFSVNSIDYTDYLRITYERPKGSLLPMSRTFKFPRIAKPLEANSNTSADEVVMETNPALRDALTELREIVGVKEEVQSTVAAILDELRQLEEDFAAHGANLQALIASLEKKAQK